MHELHQLPVVDCRLVADRQVLLGLDGTHSPIPASHTVVGQYVRMGLLGDVPRPYALANPPGRRQLEFLLKVPAERVPALLGLSSGDKVGIGLAQGKGFPLDTLAGRPLWLFATGSGIAPLRAVIECILTRRSAYGDVTLLYGVRHASDLAFQDRFGTWVGHGIQVLPVVSRPLPDTWDGRVGHVQDHLPRSFSHPEQAVVFVCGVPEMETQLSLALLERGVGAHQIFRNW